MQHEQKQDGKAQASTGWTSSIYNLLYPKRQEQERELQPMSHHRRLIIDPYGEELEILEDEEENALEGETPSLSAKVYSYAAWGAQKGKDITAGTVAVISSVASTGLQAGAGLVSAAYDKTSDAYAAARDYLTPAKTKAQRVHERHRFITDQMAAKYPDEARAAGIGEEKSEYVNNSVLGRLPPRV